MKHLFKILSILIVFNLLFFNIFQVSASDSKKHNTETVIRVAFPNQDGLSEEKTRGNYSGYSFEYLTKISEYTGWKMEYITFPDMSVDESIMKSMEMVRNGEADLIGGMLKSPAIEEMYDFCDKSYGLVYTTLSALDTNVSVAEDTFRSFKPLRVAIYQKATTRNQEIENYLKSENVQYELIYCQSIPEQMTALENDTADVVSSVSLNYFEGTRTVASFAARPYYFATTKGNIAVTKKIDEVLFQISEAFPHLQTDLYRKYFDESKSDFFMNSEQKDYIKNKKALNVLCISNSEPYVIKDKNGNLCGASVEIMNKFADEVGIKINYDYFDYSSNFYNAFDKTKYDVIIGIPTNADSNYNNSFTRINGNQYIRSKTIDTVDMVSFHKHSLNKPMSDCVVALIEGSLYGDVIDCKKVIYGKTTKELIEMVEDGKADIGFNNRYTVNFYLTSLYSNLVSAPENGLTMGICYAVSNADGNQLLSILNDYISGVTSVDLANYYENSTKYYQHTYIQDIAYENPLLFSLILILIVLFIMTTVFLIIYSRRKKKQVALVTQANNSKTEFFSRMSHDMRTPMNAILGFAEIGEDESEDKDIKSNFSNIKQSGKYLLGLINDTLDMSKIEQNKMELHPEPFEYREFEKSINNMLLPKAEAKGVSFSIRNDNPCGKTLEIDKMRIQQIFVNLIGNAIKFTPKGGNVELEVIAEPQTEEDYISHTFIVKDNGIGMSENFTKNKLFNPFEQEHNEISQNEIGTGLGVSISKKIVELMGGSIKCESKLHEGTTFTVKLRFKISEKHSIKEIDNNNDFTKLKGKKILLCEDHPMNIQIVTKLLEKKEMKVTVAQNGSIGVEIFKNSDTRQFDAILMDIRMPVMDGLEASKLIRNMDRSDAKTVPIIALSANAFDEDREKSRLNGMNAHLSKPIESNVLFKTLCEFISD